MYPATHAVASSMVEASLTQCGKSVDSCDRSGRQDELGATSTGRLVQTTALGIVGENTGRDDQKLDALGEQWPPIGSNRAVSGALRHDVGACLREVAGRRHHVEAGRQLLSHTSFRPGLHCHGNDRDFVGSGQLRDDDPPYRSISDDRDPCHRRTGVLPWIFEQALQRVRSIFSTPAS